MLLHAEAVQLSDLKNIMPKLKEILNYRHNVDRKLMHRTEQENNKPFSI
jgi:hypothetical protein